MKPAPENKSVRPPSLHEMKEKALCICREKISSQSHFEVFSGLDRYAI